MKFIKTKVNRRLLNDTTHEYEIKQVEGYLCGNKGLNIAKGYKTSWVVSHQCSGYQIFTLPLPFAQTKKAIVLLSDIIDWTMHEDLILTQADKGTVENTLINKIRCIQPETAQQILNEVTAKLEAKEPEKLPWEAYFDDYSKGDNV